MGEFGFLGDVLETINQLGDLLKDRYKSGFPILKELIQNADDAEATEFHFGFLPNGVKECSHNLLITSSVFFINNGNFSEENDRAIRSMSISSKVEQKSTIGKFGLGMKSIFHLCEAYFYITPEFKKFFNPWDSNNNKKDNESLIFQRNEVWNSFTDEDKQKIEQFFSNAKLINPDKYFLLWVPLRKKSQLIVPKSKEEIGPIVSEYFDENRPEFLDNVNNPRDLALLFPLLKHLNSISYWIDNNENQLERKYKLDFSSQKRIRFKDDMNLNTYSGEIDGVTKIKYFGKEYIEDNKNVSSEFGKLKNDNEHWPKRLTRNENGKEVTIDDKAIPHYSILFQWIQTESGKGSISFKKAVFLPLSDDKEGIKDFEYQIVFHGYFFVDSGRRNIIEPKSNENSKFISEEQVKEYWNFLLMKNISEKFLETFDGFINEQKIEYDDQTLLTKKIVQSKYYNGYKKYICSQYSWLCVIQFNEDRTNLVRKWNLVPKKDEYIYLPLELRNGFDINCLNHESLKSIFENNNIYLYDKSLKGLYSEEIKNNWDDDYKKLIIKFIQSRFFQESNIENNIVIFLDILDGFQLFSIDCEEKIWKELVSIKTNYLLIRSEWIKKKSYSSPKPDIDDFKKWFEHLEKILENDDNSLYYKLSEQLYSESNNRDLEILKSYKVFKSYSCLDEREVSISIKELEAIAGKGLLFRYSSGNATDRSKLATLFQDILLNHQIFLITQELANKTSLEYITPCDKKIILETVSKFDLELKKEHRVDLVKELNSLDINEKECIKGFRYLLHRSKNHKSDISENLWRKREAFDQKNVWYRLFKEMQGEEDWNLIDEDLILNITEEKLQKLTIKEVKKEDVLSIIDNKLNNISWNIFSNQEDADEILGNIKDENLWKCIPLHKLTNGEYIHIHGNDSIYLSPKDDTFNTIIEFEFIYNETNFVELSKNTNHKELQERFLKKFSHSQRFIELLEKQNHKYYEYHIGNISINYENINECIDIMEDYKKSPGWQILKRFKKDNTKKDDIQKIFKLLCNEVSLERIVDIMKYICERKEPKKSVGLYNSYLEIFVKDDHSIKNLNQIKLLNQKKEWRDTNRLCWREIKGLSEEYYIDEEQEILFQNFNKEVPDNQENENSELPRKADFYDYVKGFEKYIDTNWINVFYLLLNLEIMNSKIPKNELIDTLKWKKPKEGKSRVDDKEFLVAIEKHKFDLYIQKGKSMNVTFVDGNKGEALLESISEISSLFLQKNIPNNDIYPPSYNDVFQIRIILRYISQEDLKNIGDNLTKIFISTIKDIYNKIYYQDSELIELEDLIENSSQLNIKVVQRFILDTLQYSLKQIKATKYDNYLDEMFENLRSLNKNEVSKSNQNTSDEKPKLLNSINDYFLKNKNEIQNHILVAIKEKIKNFNYQNQSIPFELFQNADDAYEELLSCKKDSINNESQNELKNFIIKFNTIDNPSIIFIHWGRKINDPIYYENKKKFKWDQDLEKMLILMDTSKDYEKTDTLNTTGKFGLGFKSLYLITDNPRILSGKICTEIKGGIYPEIYIDYTRLYKVIEGLSERSKYDATLIEAPLSSEYSTFNSLIDLEDFQKFKERIGFLSIFGKQIRTIQYGDEKVSWNPRLEDTEEIEIGSINYNHNEIKVIYFRYKVGGILFQFNEKGFISFEDELERFWSVNPIQHSKAGFLINANFEVDAGRNNLSFMTENNSNIATKIGQNFINSLDYILKQEENWYKDKFNFDSNIFWNTLAKIISRRNFSLSDQNINRIYNLLFEEARYFLINHKSKMITDTKQYTEIEIITIDNETMDKSLNSLYDWAYTSSELKERRNVLFYLLEGEKKTELLGLLWENSIPDWMTNLTIDSEEMNLFRDSVRKELLFRNLKTTTELELLNTKIKNRQGDNSPNTITTYKPIDQPKDILFNIYNWWESNREKYILEYEKIVYPNGNVPKLENNNFSDWLKLLVLGASFRFGRTKSEQNRGFIEKCLLKGWWDTFSNLDPLEDSKSWMEVLEDFSNQEYDDEEYSHWMQLYPSIFRISRWKVYYLELLEDLYCQSENFNFQTFLNPNSNQEYSGSNISLPPLDKTLGKGACFVLREIVRIKEINNKNLYPYCFNYNIKIKELFTKFGVIFNDNIFLDSKSIYNKILDILGFEKSTFCYSFDIPFMIILNNNKYSDDSKLNLIRDKLSINHYSEENN